MKQTAVDWLHHKILNPTSHELLEDINLWFQKAKEMQKEQIEKAYNDGAWEVGCINSNPKKYYKETYGKDA